MSKIFVVCEILKFNEFLTSWLNRSLLFLLHLNQVKNEIESFGEARNISWLIMFKFVSALYFLFVHMFIYFLIKTLRIEVITFWLNSRKYGKLNNTEMNYPLQLWTMMIDLIIKFLPNMTVNRCANNKCLLNLISTRMLCYSKDLKQ